MRSAADGAEGFTAPFGKGKIGVRSGEAVGDQGCQHQQAISGDLKLRQTIDGVGITDLPLGDTDKRFFVAVVALDLPAVDVSVKQDTDG